MGESLVIRAATLDDVQTLARFQEAMALESEGKRLDPDLLRAGIRGVFEDPGRGRYWVAEREGELVGSLMLTLEWSDWRGGVFWWIQSVFVAEQHRGRGVYGALHRRVEADARADPGVCGVRLYVERENSHARRVYEALGMSTTSYRLYELDFSASFEEK